MLDKEVESLEEIVPNRERVEDSRAIAARIRRLIEDLRALGQPQRTNREFDRWLTRVEAELPDYERLATAFRTDDKRVGALLEAISNHTAARAAPARKADLESCSRFSLSY